MGAIRHLDRDLINKIAAGEVIERPASVVKELIENAIDAGAGNITIEIRDAGKGLIRVSDDGAGMDSEDLALSVASHSTSKIASKDDLFNIRSLGFRGEALASIASVSRLEISTNDGSGGLKMQVLDGIPGKISPAGVKRGTIVEVQDLFYNTPARMKHLKSSKTELSHIIDIAGRYALMQDSPSIRLISEGKEILNVPKTGNLINRIVAVYGKDVAKQMIRVSHEDGILSLGGFIGKPYLARKDRSLQSLFVNGRFVRNQAISNALYDAYHTLLFLDRHPVCVLNIRIDFAKTDVNVHPAKELIRIENEDEVYKSVFAAVREAFLANDLVPEVDAGTYTDRKPTKQYSLIREEQTLLEGLSGKEGTDKGRMKPQEVQDEKRKIGPVRILGQVNRLYIIAESAKGLIIIDQHAAEERVYFEKYMSEFRARDIRKQKLLRPWIFDVSPAQAAILSRSLELLQRMGIEIEEYGNGSFRIRAVPDVFGSPSEGMLQDIITELSEKSAVERAEERIASRSCRRAIKAGDVLSVPQMEKLIHDLERCEKPYACPHGRPTIISISLAELEKKFRRTG